MSPQLVGGRKAPPTPLQVEAFQLLAMYRTYVAAGRASGRNQHALGVSVRAFLRRARNVRCDPTLRSVLAHALFKTMPWATATLGDCEQDADAMLQDPALAAAERLIAAALAFRKTKFAEQQYGPITDEFREATDAYRSAVDATEQSQPVKP